jgi:hypothetical protein
LVVCNVPVIATAILRQGQESLAGRRRHTYVVSTVAFRPSDQDTNFDNTTTTLCDLGTLPVHVHVKVERDGIPCPDDKTNFVDGNHESTGHIDKVP